MTSISAIHLGKIFFSVEKRKLYIWLLSKGNILLPSFFQLPWYLHIAACPNKKRKRKKAGVIFFHLEITEVKTAIVSLILSAPFEITFLGVEDWSITIFQTFDLEEVFTEPIFVAYTVRQNFCKTYRKDFWEFRGD